MVPPARILTPRKISCNTPSEEHEPIDPKSMLRLYDRTGEMLFPLRIFKNRVLEPDATFIPVDDAPRAPGKRIRFAGIPMQWIGLLSRNLAVASPISARIVATNHFPDIRSIFRRQARDTDR